MSSATYVPNYSLCPEESLEQLAVLRETKKVVQTTLDEDTTWKQCCVLCQRPLKTKNDDEVCSLYPCGHKVHGSCLYLGTCSSRLLPMLEEEHVLRWPMI